MPALAEFTRSSVELTAPITPPSTLPTLLVFPPPLFRLPRLVHRLSAARLEEDVAALIAQGRTDREHLDRIGAVRRRIADHKAAERALSREA